MSSSGAGSLSPLSKRLLAGAGFFAATVAVLTGLGLVLTGGRAVRWKPVVATGRKLPSTAMKRATRRLRACRAAPGAPPPAAAEPDGAAVDMVGIARPQPAAGGVWLVSDPWAVDRRRKVPRDGAVWIGLPEAVKVGRVAPSGRIIRARGVLRVGRTEVPGLGTAAYRLELETLWVRETGAAEHEHDHECDH